ncbi:hypothetical protein FHG64_08245 [Antarcticibacterium flavum]|uniref:Uncharacterized protein n=1 Tax=Antarcticibacterium flavum TaxID=2058175 RepID=A0A5B7X1B9_9FLAO|nr:MULTISPECIES: hypothetical protein [Antarcticibacterium]MCM4161114.1 hypothetical protein [Antarcticibacterium sp. W02-3]QCY69384.1 hypothetical protein FHG64_08245 [Antarcticibacterium flavum]
MNILRFILILLLLVPTSGQTFAFSIEINDEPLLIEAGSQVSEDFQDLMPSRLSTSFDILKERIFPTYHAVQVKEDNREFSRSKAYSAQNRFITPGLSIPDIIFPFHTFL